MGNSAIRTVSRALGVVDPAEAALFSAMMMIFARDGYRGVQRAVERQNKHLAELHRAELEQDGWVL